MATNPNRVAALETHIGETLIIRANPTKAAVRQFVEEHNRRYTAGETGGPSGQPALKILDAMYYPNERAVHDPDVDGTPIDVADLI